MSRDDDQRARLPRLRKGLPVAGGLLVLLRVVLLLVQPSSWRSSAVLNAVFGIGLVLTVVAACIFVGDRLYGHRLRLARMAYPDSWVGLASDGLATYTVVIDTDELRLLSRRGAVRAHWGKSEIRSIHIQKIRVATPAKIGLHLDFRHGESRDLVFIRWGGLRASEPDAHAAKAALSSRPERSDERAHRR